MRRDHKTAKDVLAHLRDILVAGRPLDHDVQGLLRRSVHLPGSWLGLVKEARCLAAAILLRDGQADEAGRVLTAALRGYVFHSLPLGTRVVEECSKIVPAFSALVEGCMERERALPRFYRTNLDQLADWPDRACFVVFDARTLRLRREREFRGLLGIPASVPERGVADLIQSLPIAPGAFATATPHPGYPCWENVHVVAALDPTTGEGAMVVQDAERIEHVFLSGNPLDHVNRAIDDYIEEGLSIDSMVEWSRDSFANGHKPYVVPRP